MCSFLSFLFFDEFSSLIVRIVLIQFLLFLFAVCWFFGDGVFGVQAMSVCL